MDGTKNVEGKCEKPRLKWEDQAIHVHLAVNFLCDLERVTQTLGLSLPIYIEMLSFFLAWGSLCTSPGVPQSLHKLKNAGATWAVIDGWYPSRGERGAPGRGKGSFFLAMQYFIKRFLKRRGDGGRRVSKFWHKHLFSIAELVLWTWLKDIWS